MAKSTVLLLLMLICCLSVTAQEIDTLVKVNGTKMHFHIVKGKGIPILFEAGGGNDGTIWKGLSKRLSHITGTTLITYDRIGLGKSHMDTSKLWISKGVEALENGLQQLGYDRDIILVAHSLGGFYATLFASRHPQRVKAAVMIDINHIDFFTNEHL